MTRAAMTRRAGPAEDGVLSIELLGWLPWLFLVTLAGWQLLLVVGTATSAESAARTGARAAADGQDGGDVAMEALPSWVADHAEARQHPDEDSCDGPDDGQVNRVVVCVAVPLVVPGTPLEPLHVHRTAEMP